MAIKNSVIKNLFVVDVCFPKPVAQIAKFSFSKNEVQVIADYSQVVLPRNSQNLIQNLYV